MSIADVVEVAAPAAAMSAGSPWGAIGAGVLNYMGTQSTNEANQEVAASNNQWSAEQYAKRYQTMVSDLKSAGLNPMLAYSQSPGSAPSAQQVQFQNPMSSAVQGFTDVLGTRAKATSDVASANRAYADADKIEQQTKEIKRTLDAQGPEKAVDLLVQQAFASKEAGKTQEQIRQELIAKKNVLDKQGTLLQFDISAAKKFDNFAREYKQYAPIVELIKAIFMPRSGGITINK